MNIKTDLNKNSKLKIVKIEDSIPNTMNNKYLLYLPENYYQSNEDWPFIFFLHGAGERGNDIEIVKRHGPPKLIMQNKNFPFIIAAPQCKENMKWNIEELNTLLDEIISKYKVDTKRIYLTGLSMGGFGTWEMAIKYPDKFAAIVPICGGGDSSRVSKIKDMPIWVFHGAKDKVVPLSKSEGMVNALNECSGSPKFTIYPDAEHDSWTETYNNQNLYEWFLQHKKK
jgi:predicted peptidase